MTLIKYRRKLVFLFRGIVSSLIFKLIYRNGFDISGTILIFGSTRCGSTWLAEIISAAKGCSQIFEPLQTRYIRQAADTGVKKNMYLRPMQPWPKGQHYLQQVFSGRLINAWLASQITTRKAIQTRFLVVKIVRGNLILEWITEHFRTRRPVLIIRHPCAVVASQLNKGWTPSLKVLLSNPYFDRVPELRSRCELLKEQEELLALAWCLRYHAPLAIKKPYPFELLCYEKLVRNAEQEIERLFDIWGMVVTEKVRDVINKPSTTVTETSQVLSGNDPLAGWKKHLSENQIRKILNVVSIFGMDFYNSSVEPNYDRLYSGL